MSTVDTSVAEMYKAMSAAQKKSAIDLISKVKLVPSSKTKILDLGCGIGKQ